MIMYSGFPTRSHEVLSLLVVFDEFLGRWDEEHYYF